MMGLLYLLAFGIYLLMSLSAVIIAANRAKRHGRNPWLWGFIAVFIMYNLVFWDWLPTKFLHNYYCTTKAGFWVYKTPEQWISENPGVAEILATTTSKTDRYKAPQGVQSGYRLNDRFVKETLEPVKSFLFPVRIQDEVIVDLKTKEVLVRRRSVYSGYSGSESQIGFGALKLWVKSKHCRPAKNEFGKYEDSFYAIKEIAHEHNQ